MNTRTFLSKRWSTLNGPAKPLVRIVAGVMSLYIAYTVIHVMVDEIVQGVFIPSQYFGYFTILSGSLTSLVLLATAVAPRRYLRSNALDFARGATTLYMTMTIIIYHLLESPPNTWTWRYDTWSPVHVVAPIVMVVIWFVLLRPIPEHVKWWWPLAWVVFPFVYALVSVARGTWGDGWYPYGFLNVTQNGWVYVILMIVGLSLSVTALGYGLRASSFIKYRRFNAIKK